MKTVDIDIKGNTIKSELHEILDDYYYEQLYRFKIYNLFDSLITPTILYSLESCAMTSALEDRLDIIQYYLADNQGYAVQDLG